MNPSVLWNLTVLDEFTKSSAQVCQTEGSRGHVSIIGKCLLGTYYVQAPPERRGKATGAAKNGTGCFSRDQRNEMGDGRKDHWPRKRKAVITVTERRLRGPEEGRSPGESTPRGRRGRAGAQRPEDTQQGWGGRSTLLEIYKTSTSHRT